MATGDSPLRLGIDVGGTNTDAVVLDGSRILAAYKATTTPDVTTGIAAALASVLPSIGARRVEAVVVGTTHFINAIVRGSDLAAVACVRLATPPQTLGPLTDWPATVLKAVGRNVFVCRGGHQFDGRILNPLDERSIADAGRQISRRGIRQVVVSSVFSPIENAHEVRAREILQEILPAATIAITSGFGRIGLLERENAAILNAALLPLARDVVGRLDTTVRQLGITAPVFLSQNDGTVMDLRYARDNPVLTIASGPTNSMRGAALLSGERDCVVVDIGGTTTDVGVLRGGFPRESDVAVSLGGIRTNFRMPDVQSLGIGGGSVVHRGAVTSAIVGPGSVGYELGRRARVFGGDTLTLTDVAVAAGIMDVGARSLVADLPRDLVDRVLAEVGARLTSSVLHARQSETEVPVVVVGGAAAVAVGAADHPQVLLPDGGHVANAVGAARAQVGGEVDQIYSLARHSRDHVLSTARRLAMQRAMDAGAVASTVQIVDESDVPLSHLPGGTALRVRVRAIGDMTLGGYDAAA